MTWIIPTLKYTSRMKVDDFPFICWALIDDRIVYILLLY